MPDLRPVGYVIGLLVAAMGVAMLFPMALDWLAGDAHWWIFFESAVISVAMGGLTALACASGRGAGLELRQIFILTTGVWVLLPLFGALPLMLGAPYLGLTDAMFESVSGMTTTGATVITGIETLPLGTNLWRGLLQWLGGLGIVIVAMLFLPVMKVGGMQFFRSEGFDTLGKVLPRAMDISAALVQIYILLTVVCTMTYLALGMTGYEAVINALATISTGGYSTSDASFSIYGAGAQYAGALFMVLGSLPFIRFLQAMRGDLKPLWRDPQIRAYLRWLAYAIGVVTVYEVIARGREPLAMLTEATFNVVSVFSGTGFTSADLSQWGSFPFVILLITGLIGGCTSSTGCSIKVFRYLILFEAIRVQIRRLHNPSSVVTPRYEGRMVSDDVLNSVIVFFSMFFLSMGVLTVCLSMTGLSTKSALTAAWTSIANVGVVFGPEVGSSGAVHGFPDSAKWMMILGMLVGRLELLSVYVLLLPRFWRN